MMLAVGATVAAAAFGLRAARRSRAVTEPAAVLPTVVDDPSLPSVEIAGRRMHATAHGPLDAPVIVVLHGGPGGDHRSLLPLTELADRHRVVFYDQRGAGLSERVPGRELTAERALADLDAIVELNSPNRKVVLVGHSWGATLAAGYVRVHPDRVAAAVLAEPGYLDSAEYESWRERYDGLMSGWGYWRTAIAAGFEARTVDGPDNHAADDFLVGQRILPRFTNHPDNPYHRPGEPYRAPMWRWGKVAGDTLAGETFDPPADGIEAFGGPVLFLAGEHNTWIGPRLQARHTQRYRSAHLEVIPDSGHDMLTDNPAHTISIVRTFLASLAHCAVEIRP